MNCKAQTRNSNQTVFNRRSPYRWALFSLLFMLPGLLFAAVTASLDSNAISLGDTTTLRITTTGDDQGKQPDLAPLQKDFQLLGTSSSSQVQIINGQRSDKHEWLIELAPVTKGTLRIPALNVGSSKTTELTLQVSEQPAAATAPAGAPLFIRSEIIPSQGDTYVQQQILYTTRLYFRVPLVEGSFSDPKTENAVVERLGEDKQYNTTIEGQSYQVVERRYAIFPEHSGSLTIAPTLFSGRTVSATGRRSSFGRMDSMLEQMLGRRGLSDTFFGGTPFGDPGKKVRLGSNTVTLNIKPRPDGYSGAQWLPTEKLVIQDSWSNSPPIIHAGEPVTRTLTLEAKGLEASQLPIIQLGGSGKLRVYPEQSELSNRTDGDWIYGRSEQRFTYVASQPGRLSLPAVQVSWWDNINHKQQSSILPAWNIMVEAASGASASPTAVTVPATAPVNTTTMHSDNAKTTRTAVSAETVGEGSADHRLYWQLGSGLGIAVLLAAVFLLTRRQRKPDPSAPQTAHNNIADTPQPTRTKENNDLTRNRHSLRDACTKSDPQTAADALLEWAAATWSDQPPRSLGALAASVEQGAGEIRALEAALYGAEKQSWNGQPLWSLFEDGLLHTGKRSASEQQEAGAPPLYPDWRRQAG